jgi:hypothetical protein
VEPDVDLAVGDLRHLTGRQQHDPQQHHGGADDDLEAADELHPHPSDTTSIPGATEV